MESLSRNEKKTLEFMQHREWLAFGAIVESCSEANEEILKLLHKKGFVDFKKYFGSGNTDFYKPTQKGNKYFIPKREKAIRYMTSNWILLLGLSLSLMGNLISLITLLIKQGSI